MEEIRDYVLIVALILLALVTLVALTVLSFIAWKLLKGLRWARRQQDDRVSPLVEAAGERLTAINEELASGSGMAGLAWPRIGSRRPSASGATRRARNAPARRCRSCGPARRCDGRRAGHCRLCATGLTCASIIEPDNEGDRHESRPAA